MHLELVNAGRGIFEDEVLQFLERPWAHDKHASLADGANSTVVVVDFVLFA